MSDNRVEQWKRNLLDLSMRNPLLNAREGRKFLPIKQGGVYSELRGDKSPFHTLSGSVALPENGPAGTVPISQQLRMNTAGTDPSRPIGEKPLKGDSEGRKTPRVLMVG